MGLSHVMSRRSWIRGTAIILPLTAALLAGCGTTAKNDTYDLSAASVDGSGPSAKNKQILIADPTALKALNSDQIVIRVSPSEIQYLSRSQWSDTLPRMLPIIPSIRTLPASRASDRVDVCSASAVSRRAWLSV